MKIKICAGNDRILSKFIEYVNSNAIWDELVIAIKSIDKIQFAKQFNSVETKRAMKN